MRTSQIPVTDPAAGLRLTEMFYSLQGEANHSGWPTVFVRLTGCPLRCVYCDTTYSFEGGERHSLEQIMQQVASYGTRHVCVTGGEPLAQPNCIPLLKQLCDAGYHVSLETSGALDISKVDLRVSRVVDLKTPNSGEMTRNLLSNLEQLTAHDQLKFVIMNRQDYEWSRDMLAQYDLATKVSSVWFSPAFAVDHASAALPALAHDLAEWILADRLHARFQLQLHKLLWRDAAGH